MDFTDYPPLKADPWIDQLRSFGENTGFRPLILELTVEKKVIEEASQSGIDFSEALAEWQRSAREESEDAVRKAKGV